MIAITLAFKTRGINSPSICLYSGNDAAQALETAKNPPAGYQRCEVFVNPVPRKRIFADPVLPGTPAVDAELPLVPVAKSTRAKA